MSRADKIRPEQKIPEYYSDFRIDFGKTPVTYQLDLVKNADAVKQSIRNLILTDRNERPYQPLVGSRIKESLFENIDDIVTIENIRDSVEKTIENYEPRANIERVEVISNDDLNSYEVNIHFTILNFKDIFTVEIIVERSR